MIHYSSYIRRTNLVNLNILMFYNLRVRNVILLDGPAPTTVRALSSNTYTVSGDNSSIVPLSVSLTKLVIFVPLCRKEYCVITPLGI